MRPALDRSWWQAATWDGWPLRDYLARHQIAVVFRAVHQRGWSLAAIAAATGLTAGRVSEIAAGKREVTAYAVLERIADGLNVPRHYMGLGFGDPGERQHHGEVVDDHVLEDPLQRRTLIGALASLAVGAVPPDLERWLPRMVAGSVPDKVSWQEVAAVRATTQMHRRMDAARGGGACLVSARGYLGWARGLLSAGCDSDQVAAELRRAVADLHNLVGWVSHDLNRHGDARRHLTQGLLLAQQADDLTLMADSYYRLGRVSLHQGEAGEALHLFQLGKIVAQNSGCLASVAILNANEAWAYAMLGVAQQVDDALARARNELERVDPDTVPAWTRFAVAEADVHGMAGVVYGALARHVEHRHYAEQAIARSTNAVALRRPEERRSCTFDHIAVATAAALVGEHGEAAKHADHALALAGQGAVRSTRAIDRLEAMWKLAKPHADRHSDLAAVGARIEAVRAA